MARPTLFLVPTWTELEWTIRPQLEEWAEVASYDPASVAEHGEITRDAIVAAGLAELERLGWDEPYVVGDTFGTATAARIAHARRDALAGVALGHACLSWDMDGDRAPVKRELCEAMEQLMSQDVDSFARHGLTQITQGSYDEALAQEMVKRIPSDVMRAIWALADQQHEPIGELLREIDRPLLLAQHEGCLVFTDEGFEDVVATFPQARSLGTPTPPGGDPEFAAALREFCGAE